MKTEVIATLWLVKGTIVAISLVMNHTKHTLVLGSQALEFTLLFGLLGPTNLSIDNSLKVILY